MLGAHILETFDSPTTLRREFDAIISAAGLDALGVAPGRTPARRAIRFVDRAIQGLDGGIASSTWS